LEIGYSSFLRECLKELVENSFTGTCRRFTKEQGWIIVSKRVNKQVSSFAFSLQKAYERLLSSKPSWFIIALLAAFVSIVLLGGVSYNMIVGPAVAYFGSTGNMMVFYYSLSDQFILESLLVMIFYGLGFAGFLVAYRSTKYAYNPRNAYRFLLVGAALLIIGIVLMETGLNAKFGL
jgi:hypothetical protein